MPAFLELIDKIYCQSCRRHVRIHMQGTIKGPWVLDPVQTKLTIHYISPLVWIKVVRIWSWIAGWERKESCREQLSLAMDGYGT